MARPEISPADQLAEGERILRYTKRQAKKIREKTGMLPLNKAQVLLTREAIVATLRRNLLNKSPLN